jgi:hypothetical protein
VAVPAVVGLPSTDEQHVLGLNEMQGDAITCELDTQIWHTYLRLQTSTCRILRSPTIL